MVIVIRWIPFQFVSLVLILIIMITGCGKAKPLDDSDLSQKKSQTQEAGRHPSIKQSKIKLYYSDANLNSLIEKVGIISYQNKSEKYKAALDALKKAPSENALSLWGRVTFKTVSFHEGNLVINIYLPNEARLGSLGEQFALEALRRTLFQFTEVQSIDLLVDGKREESLMGHVELDHPMKRMSVPTGS